MKVHKVQIINCNFLTFWMSLDLFPSPDTKKCPILLDHLFKIFKLPFYSDFLSITTTRLVLFYFTINKFIEYLNTPWILFLASEIFKGQVADWVVWYFTEWLFEHELLNSVNYPFVAGEVVWAFQKCAADKALYCIIHKATANSAPTRLGSGHL